MQEWFSPLELAGLDLPSLPKTERAIQLLADRKNWRSAEGEYPANPSGWWRKRAGRGGGLEYKLAILPMRARAALALREARNNPPPQTGAAWSDFEAAPDRKKDEARRRFAALDAVDALVRSGMQRDLAMMTVANRDGIALRTLYHWAARVAGCDKSAWLPHLLSRHVGRKDARSECAPEAWEALKSDFLRLEEPSFQSCYRRLEEKAKKHGWTISSARALERRIWSDIPAETIILAREGAEALKRKYPAQQRDRSVFHALEAINGDGHKLDIFATTPAGAKIRPVIIAFQDLFSGKILSWRLCESENRIGFMLAFGDIVEKYGIPEHLYYDNTRAAANKWLTGGVKHRYRFKVKEDEIPGVLKTLGVEVHWTRPYSGQSKPIERAFRDFADDIAKHPNFAGSYTGNTPAAKPENYGSRAVEWDLLEKTVAHCVAEHNARKGRRSQICGGKLSFDDAFAASYETAIIRKATSEQRRLWLMAAESVKVRKDDAAIHLLGNRYWAEFLPRFAGRNVCVRFDPNDLHNDIHVYALDGAYVGAARCIARTGFNDQAAASEHGRARKQYMKGVKLQLDAERRMGLADSAPDLPDAPAFAPQAPSIIRPTFGALALKPQEQEDARCDQEETLDAFGRGVTVLFPALRGGKGE